MWRPLLAVRSFTHSLISHDFRLAFTDALCCLRNIVAYVTVGFVRRPASFDIGLADELHSQNTAFCGLPYSAMCGSHSRSKLDIGYMPCIACYSTVCTG